MLSGDIYSTLRDEIIHGKSIAGSKLNLDDIARRLHVSNTPVRQALAQLVEDGLVVHVPYRGFEVSPILDGDEIRRRYEYRLLLEPGCAALAAQRRTEDEAQHLLDISDPILIGNAIIEDRQDDFIRRDINFHHFIVQSTRNEILVRQLNNWLQIMHEYSVHWNEEYQRISWREHRLIAEAIKDSNAPAAMTSMKEHLVHATKRFQAQIRSATKDRNATKA